MSAVFTKQDIKDLMKDNNIDCAVRMKCIEEYFHYEDCKENKPKEKEKELLYLLVFSSIIFITTLFILSTSESYKYVAAIIAAVVSLLGIMTSYEKLFKEK